MLQLVEWLEALHQLKIAVILINIHRIKSCSKTLKLR